MQTDATLLTNNSQHCRMLHVASVCSPCCMLMDVGCCCAKFETGQTFNPVEMDATLLAYNSQYRWELLPPLARSLKQIRSWLVSFQNLNIDDDTISFEVQLVYDYTLKHIYIYMGFPHVWPWLTFH